MSTTTTNFGWTIPSDTDLVKDGASAMRTLGQAIDTSMADLEGGTTGQVLSKTSNTDMDFTWVTPDDANAIQNAIVDAKGDLIAATAADTPARLAVGTNGQVLTADSTAATGLAWAAPASGGMTLLSTTTLSGSSTLVSTVDANYKNLYIEITNFLPATDDARLYMRPNSVSTSNTYYNGEFSLAAGGYAFNDTTWTLTLGSDNTTASNISAFTIPNYASTTTWKTIQGVSFNNSASAPTTTVSYRSIIGASNITAAVSSLYFHTSSGNFTSGTVKVYGVK